MQQIISLLENLDGLSNAEKYINIYNAIEMLEEHKEVYKKRLVDDAEFMEAVTNDGYKLSRIVTQKFVPNKTVEELKFLFPSAVLTQVIPATEEKTVESINVDLLRADPEAHQFLDTKRSETMKVTKPKAAK